ncbi:MAG: HNH endonuclease [Deltaproteobacteria bacterium]|nr:HNH endonuclease [Deltaproteobacteria bacterium]MCX7952431.1 HNH endonuclease [Deltaproteobacteria bacterium]
MKPFKPVLLLNASYEPLKVITWKRAINLYFANKVEIIETYDHVIRSVNLSVYLPSVVRLLHMAKHFRRSVPLTRANLLARDGFRCQYCGSKLNPVSATIDHIIPRSRGGQSTWENMVTSCASCNRKKGDKTPSEAGLTLLAHPRKPLWLPILRDREEVPTSWRNYIFYY